MERKAIFKIRNNLQRGFSIISATIVVEKITNELVVMTRLTK